jgi:hypothetical protein
MGSLFKKRGTERNAHYIYPKIQKKNPKKSIY